MQHSWWKRKRLDFDADWGDGDPDGVVLTALSPIPFAEGWNAAIRIERIDGHVRFTGLEVWSDMPSDQDLNGELLRKLGLRAVQEEILETLETGALTGNQALVPAEWFDNFLSTPRPGRRSRPLVEYAVWARRYERALAEAPKSPNKWLAEKYDHPGGPAAVAQIIKRARDKRLLEDVENGKPGGKATRAAHALLKHVEED